MPHVNEHAKDKQNKAKNSLTDEERADPRLPISQRKCKLLIPSRLNIAYQTAWDTGLRHV